MDLIAIVGIPVGSKGGQLIPFQGVISEVLIRLSNLPANRLQPVIIASTTGWHNSALIPPILDKTAINDCFVENVRKEAVRKQLVLLGILSLHALGYRLVLPSIVTVPNLDRRVTGLLGRVLFIDRDTQNIVLGTVAMSQNERKRGFDRSFVLTISYQYAILPLIMVDDGRLG